MSKQSVCHLCNKTFINNSNKNRHLREVHNTSTGGSNLNCFICSKELFSMKNLVDHLNKDHDQKIETKTKKFNSLKDFKIFKERKEYFEKENYIKHGGDKKSNNIIISYFYCCRSGNEIKKPFNLLKRSRKKTGSIKINKLCTAYMVVKTFALGQIEVSYVDHHCNHENKPCFQKELK